MRTIKFRGKASNGEWIYGSLVRICGELVGIKPDTTPFIGDNVRVDPDTVGQYIGLCDSKGVELYEGDIIAVNGRYEKLIAYQDGEAAFCMANINELQCQDAYPWQRIYPDWWNDKKRTITIKGNIHDNLEMIKV